MNWKWSSATFFPTSYEIEIDTIHSSNWFFTFASENNENRQHWFDTGISRYLGNNMNSIQTSICGKARYIFHNPLRLGDYKMSICKKFSLGEVTSVLIDKVWSGILNQNFVLPYVNSFSVMFSNQSLKNICCY